MDTLRRLAAVRFPLLAVLAALVLLPGINRVPPLDRDESRYAEATAQMLATGDFIDVRFQDQPRYLQPAGIYWLQSAAVALTSSAQAREIWANRIPGAIGAIVSVLLTCWIGSMLFGPVAGLVAGLLLCLTVLLNVEARMATIDATLLCAILTAQTALLHIWRARDGVPARIAPWVFWAAFGVGLMLKGPVIALVSFGTLIGLGVLERRWRWMRQLRWGWGLLLALAIVAPWCIAIGVKSGGDFFARSLGTNFFGKVATGQQAHGLPPGYYLGVFVLSFWPGSLLAALALPWVWAERRTPQVKFLVAWIVPTWVVFELVATKLPHYVLPTYPAIACLTAAALLAPVPWQPGRIGRVLASIYGALWLMVGLALAVAGVGLLGYVQHEVRLVPVLAALAGVPLVLLAGRAILRRRPAPALACATAAALVIYAATFTTSLPDLTTIWLSPRIAAAVAANRPCPDSVLASASFSEPSLVYLVGRDTRLVGPAASADHLRDNPACALALVDARDAATFQAQAAADGISPHALTQIDGINYSTGKRLALTLYAAADAAAAR